MREIKFRAWDSVDKRILPDFYDNESLFAQFKGGGLILMEYIGIPDKNKKDIYEGDIVRYKDHLKYRREVVVFPFSVFYDSEQPIVSELCEVIGNIHENPELLNK